MTVTAVPGAKLTDAQLQAFTAGNVYVKSIQIRIRAARCAGSFSHSAPSTTNNSYRRLE